MFIICRCPPVANKLFCSTLVAGCQIWTLVSRSASSSSWPPPVIVMDGDGSSNAVAGPSTLPDAILSYLPPAGKSSHCAWCLPHANRFWIHLPPSAGPSRPTPYFKSTEDLLSKFQLLSAYDSHVRPFLPPDDASPDKGKGKQRDMSPIPDPHSMHSNDPDDDELDRRRKKNNYKHLIKGIPGSMTLCAPFQQSTFAHPASQENTRPKRTISWPQSCKYRQNNGSVSYHSIQ